MCNSSSCRFRTEFTFRFVLIPPCKNIPVTSRWVPKIEHTTTKELQEHIPWQARDLRTDLQHPEKVHSLRNDKSMGRAVAAGLLRLLPHILLAASPQQQKDRQQNLQNYLLRLPACRETKENCADVCNLRNSKVQIADENSMMKDEENLKRKIEMNFRETLSGRRGAGKD